jgi:glucose/arabinose dehydrogenase
MFNAEKLSRWILLFMIAVVLANVSGATDLTTVRVASGLSSPTYVTSSPGDSSRLFILEQRGIIKILKNGDINPSPFLDIDSLISSGGERGLLGLAFHPGYQNNGYFYVDYTNNSGNTVIARYQVSGDPDIADPGSSMILLTINQPYSNHNGGMLAFGPDDGYLYVGMGDGGSAGDPQNRAQNDSTLLGKLLRIDVDGGSPYGIPPDNPYVGGPGLDEIWAKGLRNPWRFTFDRETYDMYIGDVGQNIWEEIDFEPASSTGGENYGWRFMEGSHCYNPPVDCDPGGLTYPIYEYDHSSGRCSVTGGYVYRGNVIPSLRGTYFFADYCSGDIWSFEYGGNNVNNFQDRTAELDPAGNQAINNISSFGEDAYGEIYICDFADGEIYKIVPASPGNIQGSVIDQQGQPLADVYVSLQGTPILDSTDTDGNYLLGGMGDGTFDVLFYRPPLIDSLISGVTVFSGDTTILNISLQQTDTYTYLPGDANMTTGMWPASVLGGDVTYMVSYFRGLPTNPACNLGGFYCAADANGDCQVIGSDVTRLVNYFRGLIQLSYCAAYIPEWLSPDDLPQDEPSGWPNCEMAQSGYDASKVSIGQ